MNRKDYPAVERQLQQALAVRFADVSVRVGDGIHYRGTNVVVTSRAFAGLLPEQRFHHVVRAIPPDLYDRHLRSGVVWFELAPGETGRDYMKMPRSEDVKDRSADLERRLEKIGFAKRLRQAWPKRPPPAADLGFALTRDVLSKAGLEADVVERMCLYLILRGAFCDQQVATLYASESPAVED